MRIESVVDVIWVNRWYRPIAYAVSAKSRVVYTSLLYRAYVGERAYKWLHERISCAGYLCCARKSYVDYAWTSRKFVSTLTCRISRGYAWIKNLLRKNVWIIYMSAQMPVKIYQQSRWLNIELSLREDRDLRSKNIGDQSWPIYPQVAYTIMFSYFSRF